MSDFKMHLYGFVGTWLPVLWMFAVGACVGSLVNVLVYRLPKGLPVVVPSSRCPKCNTKLTFRENIPILGWLMLKGRCRFCKEPISPEYPIVETLVAVLFAMTYILWYVATPGDVGLFGFEWGSIKPEWAKNGPLATWPAFVVILILIGSLVAMTIVDLKTFTIPLVLTWVPVGVALIFYPVNALIVGEGGLRHTAGSLGDWIIAMPWPDGWWWLGMCVGAIAGLVLANVLMLTGAIGRSFADYEEWEAKALAEEKARMSAEGLEPDPPLSQSDMPDMWVQYPHARREMVRELAFLAPAAALGWGGALLAQWLGGTADMPLVLRVLTGVMMGYLVGGAVVWGVRIFGSLVFGKEAMGLGDVHVLAAVGACLGWPAAILTFFAAVLVGLGGAIAGLLFRSKVARMMAFGPCLAIGALVVLYGMPWIESGLGQLMGRPGGVNLP